MAAKVGIVIVSHSPALAGGVVELAAQMTDGSVPLEAAGGRTDGGLGTSEQLVLEASRRAEAGAGVLILGDIGSAILTVRSLLADDHGLELALADAPLVEGAVSAAVAAAGGGDLGQVRQAAEAAGRTGKL